MGLGLCIQLAALKGAWAQGAAKPTAAPPAAQKPAAPAAKPSADEKRQKALHGLMDTDYADTAEAVRNAMAGVHRKEGRFYRDYYRHPVQTLGFFGLKQDMTVLELWPGSGWYTEILAPVVAKKGKLKVTNGDASSANATEENSGAKRYAAFLAAVPEVYGKVEVVTIDPPKKLELGAPESVDMVLTFRNLHNWQEAGFLDKLLPEVNKVLKKGGVFGVVDHRAKPGQNPAQSAKSGYLAEAWVIKTIEAAGFKLAAKSEINANSKDTRDYKEGVWTLSPGFTLGAKDREKYVAIGESDRMTLRFVKK